MYNDIERMLCRDYRLTTAEILYRFPDHPSLLQTYLWQELDLTPDFPELTKFLEFWDKSLDGKVHSVLVTACDEMRATEYLGRAPSIPLH